MPPLPSIAMGLLIVLLTVPAVGGYDLVADPVGWVLVLLGVVRLEVDRRTLLLGLAALAGLVSAALWLPGVREPLLAGDPALVWTVNLPQVAFVVLLSWGLSQHARAEGAGPAAGWLSTTAAVLLLAGVGPVLVFGAGVTALAQPTYVAAGAGLLMLVALLFWYARRDWVPQHDRPAAG